MNAYTLSPRLIAPGAAIVYDQLQGEKIHVLLSGQDTADSLALFIDEVPPHAGPPLHIHQHEDETFYVLEGELVVQVDEKRFAVSAGSAVFLPRGIPHTFTNVGAQTAKSLVALTPAGLEGFFAAVEPLATQAEPDMTAILAVAADYGIEAAGPPLGSRIGDAPITPTSTWVVRPEEADTYGIPGGETIKILLTGEQTGGHLALLHGEFQPGNGTSLHRHRHEDETFYVLEGSLDMQVGTVMETAVAGTAAFLPKDISHEFRNNGEQPAKAVAIIAPAGFENYFAESYTLFAAGKPDGTASLTLAQKYNLETNL